ncbi:hypothetical protein BRSU_0639 [Brachyspira suanatina]|uniref:Uncharacterized protein n=1 Tax=Brachyspira suanatina TaxID=381802 RepID=A0A0G4K4Y4_9SPIR|nr:hypothetical protein [Brachyspira suanatina]CRF32194.1 hypothetical protein BRSU_0639 [Brachyspira suanatina]
MIDYNEIKTILENNYIDCYSTITEISSDNRDKNKTILFLINNKRAINFDAKLSKKFKSTEETHGNTEFKAVDMIHIKNDTIDLIEFKNITSKKDNYYNKLKVQGIESLIVLFNLLKKEQLINTFNQLFDFNFIKINYYIIVPDKLGANNYSYNEQNRNRLEKLCLFSRLETEYSHKFFYNVTAYNASSFENNYINVHIN